MPPYHSFYEYIAPPLPSGLPEPDKSCPPGCPRCRDHSSALCRQRTDCLASTGTSLNSENNLPLESR